MSGYHKRDSEPFPLHKLKRVGRPTTKILDDQVKRADEWENGFNKAVRGDYGPVLQRERQRFVIKHPISGALSWMTAHLKGVVDGLVAAQKAPLPEDPVLLSRHIKELAYFLRADDLLGYGKPRPEEKWWLDLEDVDGVLRIPSNKES